MWSEILRMALLGGAIVTGMMFLLWLLHLAIKNASVVDPGWSYGLAIMAITAGWMGKGYPLRRAMIAAMVTVWGVRLGTHLLFRIVGKPEEGRYKQMRKDWKSNLALKFLIFFEAQALLDIFLALPFMLAAVNPEPSISELEIAGVALWAVAIIGEAVADAQLSAFKRSPEASTGAVCRRGLWNYSRHPNYFFEWLVWVAWAMFALASPWGWLAITCPLLMLYLLFRVTGIPATEAQSLRSKGNAYREYQRTTSAFVPWARKAA